MPADHLACNNKQCGFIKCLAKKIKMLFLKQWIKLRKSVTKLMLKTKNVEAVKEMKAKNVTFA